MLFLHRRLGAGFDLERNRRARRAPLILTGLAVAVAFRAKFWNIGAEGQLYAGAMAAAFVGGMPCSRRRCSGR